MKFKWFRLFDDSIVRDEHGDVNRLETIKKSYALAFHDPFYLVLLIVAIVLMFVIK